MKRGAVGRWGCADQLSLFAAREGSELRSALLSSHPIQIKINEK